MTSEEEKIARDELNQNERGAGELPEGGPEKVGYLTGLFGGLVIAFSGSLLLGMFLGAVAAAATITYHWILMRYR